MRAPRTETPRRTLSRYFFQSFFRLTFLDDAGEESFKRGIIGLLAVTIAMGLFVARLYMVKYGHLSPALRAELQWIVAADQLLMICLPMFVTTLVMALVVHSVFPDELDFRILMALPIKRSTIFAAKVSAVFRFVTLFIAGATIGFGLPFATMSSGRFTGVPIAIGIAAPLVAEGMGCAFAIGAVIAIQGLVTVAVPASFQRRLSTLLQTAIVSALVLSMPVVAHVPGLWPTLRERPLWMFVTPPGWFLGLEQWLLGNHDPYFGRLAIAGAAASIVLAAVVVLCYAVVYRRFDQALLRAAQQRHSGIWAEPLRSPWSRHPAQEATQAFISATLRRSGLHLLVFSAVFAAGCALAVNHMLGTTGERSLIRAVFTAQFTLMAGAIVGVRMALLLPTNLRAGWIFRFTETAINRPRQLDAVRRTLLVSGVVMPMALASPICILTLGWRTFLSVAPLVAFIGWTLVETVCINWRRVPFTCTFLFAKRPPAYTLFLILMIFGWFVFIAGGMADAARTGLRTWLVVAGILSIVHALVRWFRVATWGRHPLEFEDYLPDGLETLRLN